MDPSESSWDDGSYDKLKSAIGNENRQNEPELDSEFEEEVVEEEELVDADMEGLVRSNQRPYMKLFLLVILVLPSLTYCAMAINDILTRYSFATQGLHVFAVPFGGSAATLVCIRTKAIRSNLAFVVPVALSVMCLPSYQVYRCSPIEIDNIYLGKNFKMMTSAQTITEKSYLRSSCFKNTTFQAPYSMAIFTPSVVLTVSSGDLTNLFADSEESESNSGYFTDDETPAAQSSANYYLARSIRIVKGKRYKLFLLLKIPTVIKGLDASLKETTLLQEPVTLRIYGTLKDVDDKAEVVRRRVLSKEYTIRPVMLVVAKAQTVENSSDQ